MEYGSQRTSRKARRSGYITVSHVLQYGNMVDDGRDTKKRLAYLLNVISPVTHRKMDDNRGDNTKHLFVFEMTVLIAGVPRRDRYINTDIRATLATW